MNDVLRQVTMVLRAIWRHRLLGILVAWAGAIIGVVVVLMIPDKYEASARIYVDTQSILKPLMSGLAVQPNVEQQVMMLSRTLISRPNVEKLIRMADLDLALKNKLAQDELVDRLVKTLEIKSTSRDNLYTLSFRDPDPNKSKRVVQSLVSIFVESSLGDKRKDSDSAKKFLDEQIKTYEKKLEDAEARLKDFKVRNLDAQTADGRGVIGQMADVSARLSQAQLDLREAQNAREAVRRQILGDSGGPKGAEDPAGISIPEIDNRIDAQKRNLDTLLQKYTEQHPDVLGARRVLKDLEQQKREQAAAMRKAAASNPSVLLGDGSTASQDLKRALAVADGNVATLTTRVAEYEGRMARYKLSLKNLPEVEKEFAQLNRDYEINKKNYEGLVARRESAAMSGELEAASGVADFRLIDPPRVSPKPVAPNRLLLLPAVLVLSLTIGIFASFSAAQFRPVFFDGHALREATGLPLLGRVSYISNPAGERRERWNLRAFFGLLGLLVGIFCVGSLYLFLYS
jgi:polysaccharide chain length determinant protein (PEP-CTERM system associated)